MILLTFLNANSFKANKKTHIAEHTEGELRDIGRLREIAKEGSTV